MSILSVAGGLTATGLALSLVQDLLAQGGAAATAGLSLDAVLANGRAIGALTLGLTAALLAWSPLRRQLWFSAVGLSFGLLGAVLTVALYVE